MHGVMETHNVSLRGVKVDPLAHELATSEGTRPYLDCVIKAYRNNATKELELRFQQFQMLLQTFTLNEKCSPILIACNRRRFPARKFDWIDIGRFSL